MKQIIQLALRSLLYRKKQYLSLFLVCVVGTGISLFCLFLMDGMLDALNSKAKIYYGGDLQFIGGKNALEFNNAEKTVSELKTIFKEASYVTARFDFDADFAYLYFEGTGVRQRVIKGVDFNAEAELFKKFTYTQGDATKIAGKNGILLSAPIAEMLSVSVGDSVTLMLRDKKGYLNTEELEVYGIFKDSSLFGMYTSYMDINVLKRLYGMSPAYANRITAYFGDNGVSKKQTLSYYKKLQQLYNMFKMVPDKKMFYDQLLTRKFSEPCYALITLDANFADVKILISAMHIICYFIIIMLVVIIVAGISSTYRVLILKRMNELGIYMAIGMNKRKVTFYLCLESFFLLISGLIFGLIFSFILCKFVSFFNFSIIPAFDIFLTDSHLFPKIHFLPSCNLILVVLVCTMGAVFVSVKKSIRVMPAEALSVTE